MVTAEVHCQPSLQELCCERRNSDYFCLKLAHRALQAGQVLPVF